MPVLPFGIRFLLKMNAMSVTAGIASISLATARAQEDSRESNRMEAWGSTAAGSPALAGSSTFPADDISYSEQTASNDEGHGVRQPGPKEKEECPNLNPTTLSPLSSGLPKECQTGTNSLCQRKGFP